MKVAHAAVVLAAGGSTRLGRPKQLLTRDGETLVHRAARLAIATGATRVLVVTGAQRGEQAADEADGECPLEAFPQQSGRDLEFEAQLRNAARQRGRGVAVEHQPRQHAAERAEASANRFET